MAVYCGVDIVEIDRIMQSMESTGDAFKKRVFTENEINYCEARNGAKFQSYAARFAAKEAVSKAFGTGFTGSVKWRDIEILNNGNGKPYVVLSSGSKEIFGKMKGKGISLSLSHCKSHAVAYAVIETE